MRALIRSLSALALVVMLVACQPPERRELPFPEFQSEQPFQLTSEAAGGPSDDELGQREQSFVLAGRLAGTLPQDFDAWLWAGDQTRSLAIHRTRGQLDALIYTEAIDQGMARPSLGADRFHRTVSPSLASPVLAWTDLSLPESLVKTLADDTGQSELSVSAALRRLATASLGRGLGFTMHRDTFTGWKWIGRNRQGVDLRLSRALGRWGGQEPLDDKTRAVLDGLANLTDRADPLLADATPSAESGPTGQQAMLVIGRALTPDGQDGVHLAIFCTLSPSCPVATDLARLLDSLDRPTGATWARLGGSDVATFARQRIGLVLEDDPPASSAVLRDADAAARARLEQAEKPSDGVEEFEPGATEDEASPEGTDAMEGEMAPDDLPDPGQDSMESKEDPQS